MRNHWDQAAPMFHSIPASNITVTQRNILPATLLRTTACTNARLTHGVVLSTVPPLEKITSRTPPALPLPWYMWRVVDLVHMLSALIMLLSLSRVRAGPRFYIGMEQHNTTPTQITQETSIRQQEAASVASVGGGVRGDLCQRWLTWSLVSRTLTPCW